MEKDVYNDLDRIEVSQIEESLVTCSLGRRIFYYEQIDSTNTQAKRLVKEELVQEALHGALVLAEEQLNGRGRLGRDWSSPKEGGIWMSFILNPKLPVSSCPMLTLVAAMAVNSAIRRVSGLTSFIKWPNDIVVNGKKVCGILTEITTGRATTGGVAINNTAGPINTVRSEAASEQGRSDTEEINIILGIGINANRKEFPSELHSKATSLSLEKGEDLNRGCLIAEICNSLEKYYEEFVHQGDLAELKAEYEEYLINKGKQVLVLKEEEEYPGIALGINEQGALLIETKENGVETIVSGEVSVRGILGYV